MKLNKHCSQNGRPRGLDFIYSILFILLLWHGVVWVTGVPSFILPGPLKVVNAMVDNLVLLADHAAITAVEVVIGLVLGTGLGVVTALLLTASAHVRRYAMPMLVISQTIPVFALAPLLTLWFGYGLQSKIVMTVLIVYFPVTSTFFDGLRSTPAGFLDLAHTMRARPLQTLFQIRVPAAIPALTSGIKLAAVYAPIGAVIGEWVGASKGLGYLMLLANGRVKTDLLFAALIVLCTATILLRVVVSRGCKRVDQWAGQSG